MWRGAMVGAALVLVLVVAGAASGEPVRTAVSVSPESNDTLVAGELHSPRGFCVRNRPVALKRKVGDGATVEGRATADRQGHFEIAGAFLPSNRYFAAVSRRVVVVNGQRRVCGAARSAYFRLG